MEAKSILSDLRDIPGVTGSFVLSLDGEAKLRDLPAVIRDDALSEVGPRVVRLLDAFGGHDRIDSCALRFTSHRLHLRQAGTWVLCVLSEESVNAPTLRMGMTLVARRVATMKFDTPELSRETIPPAMPIEHSPTAAPTTHRPKMIYRGAKTQ